MQVKTSLEEPSNQAGTEDFLAYLQPGQIIPPKSNKNTKFCCGLLSHLASSTGITIHDRYAKALARYFCANLDLARNFAP